MKKITLLLAAALLSAGAHAQTMQDALLFSTNNYYGTARTMALGNAVTALGGDLGSIGINPAGSAVATYSQLVITPGLSVSSVNSAFSQSGFTMLDTDASGYVSNTAFNASSKSRLSRMTMPNVGMTMRYETGNISGVTAITFGFVNNNTGHFSSSRKASGINKMTSMTGSMAALAQTNADGMGARLDPDVFSADYDPYYDPYRTIGGVDRYWNWNLLAGYDAYLFGDDDGNGVYSGAAQDENSGTSVYSFPLAGDLAQQSSVTELGNKSDIIMNMGIDINDRVYVGMNIGLPRVKYRSVESFREEALVEELFPSGFSSMDYRYQYDVDASGIYAKVGIIALPTDHLRLGASIQSPSDLTVNERYRIDASSVLGGKTYRAADVPVGYNDYSLRTPWIVDAGIAYTFGTSAMVSVDYEMVDYSIMKFNTLYYDAEYDTYVRGGYDSYYDQASRLCRLFCGTSHSLRAGAEFRLTPMFSLRGGFSVVTSPVKYYVDSDGYVVDASFYADNYDFYEKGGASLDSKHFLSDPVKSFSLGFGYSSNGSFFADAAAKLTSWNDSFMAPYATYYKLDTDAAVASPLIRSRRNLLDVALTLGWRF